MSICDVLLGKVVQFHRGQLAWITTARLQVAKASHGD